MQFSSLSAVSTPQDMMQLSVGLLNWTESLQRGGSRPLLLQTHYGIKSETKKGNRVLLPDHLKLVHTAGTLSNGYLFSFSSLWL